MTIRFWLIPGMVVANWFLPAGEVAVCGEEQLFEGDNCRNVDGSDCSFDGAADVPLARSAGADEREWVVLCGLVPDAGVVDVGDSGGEGNGGCLWDDIRC